MSVPCSTCRQGCWAASSRPRYLDLTHARHVGGDLERGEAVDVSVAAAALNRASILLFGPTVLWAVLVAGTGAFVSASTELTAALAVIGLLVALSAGRWLTARRPAGDLDVRLHRRRTDRMGWEVR